MGKFFWVSWYQNTDDYRPIHFPPNSAILGWWCTGHGDKGATLVAVVEARDSSAVLHAIVQDWPEFTGEVRFCDLIESPLPSNFGERFPMADWMVERFDLYRQLHGQVA